MKNSINNYRLKLRKIYRDNCKFYQEIEEIQSFQQLKNLIKFEMELNDR